MTTEALVAFEFKTVTYETDSASFLAVTVMHELAKESSNFPLGSAVINDFYIDDLLTGADSKSEII